MKHFYHSISVFIAVVLGAAKHKLGDFLEDLIDFLELEKIKGEETILWEHYLTIRYRKDVYR